MQISRMCFVTLSYTRTLFVPISNWTFCTKCCAKSLKRKPKNVTKILSNKIGCFSYKVVVNYFSSDGVSLQQEIFDKSDFINRIPIFNCNGKKSANKPWIIDTSIIKSKYCHFLIHMYTLYPFFFFYIYTSVYL